MILFLILIPSHTDCTFVQLTRDIPDSVQTVPWWRDHQCCGSFQRFVATTVVISCSCTFKYNDKETEIFRYKSVRHCSEFLSVIATEAFPISRIRYVVTILSAQLASRLGSLGIHPVLFYELRHPFYPLPKQPTGTSSKK